MGAVLRLVRDHADHYPTPTPTLNILEQYEAYMSAYGCSPATVRTRLAVLAGLLAYVDVNDPLELTRDHVITWLGRPVKAWTRHTYYKTAVHFSKWLHEFGYDPESDLTKGIPRPPTPQPVARPIDDATIERMLALKLTPRPHAYVRLALFQALRVHEVAKVRAEDFDLASGWLLVTGKGDKTVPIPIHPEVAKLAGSMPELGYWFPSHTESGHVSPVSVSKTISVALERCGSTATAHQLRDTAATRMQRQVKDIRLTQAMMRHGSIRSTQKYTEAANADLEKAVKALDWQDASQAAAGPALPSLAGLNEEQRRQLMAELQMTLPKED